MKGEIRFLRGRLKFNEAKNSAPFPSAVVVFRPQLRAELLGAIARGWCTPENSHKEMDAALVKAIADEVEKLERNTNQDKGREK